MKRFEHREEKWEFPFVEYSGEPKNEKVPLVVQLHGAGERGFGEDDLEKVDIHGFSDYLKNAEHNCIVIMPQCPADTFWAARVESIIKFIEHLIQEFNVDEDRVYLTGLSMGGFGTWYTAMEFPQMFAAIAPVCGGGMPWNAGMLSMPVWAFHGDKDDLVLPSNSIDMINALRAQGRGDDVKFNLLEGVGHNAWDYAYNKELFDWLLSHKRA